MIQIWKHWHTWSGSVRDANHQKSQNIEISQHMFLEVEKVSLTKKKQNSWVTTYSPPTHAPPPPVLINQGEYNMVVNKSISQVSQLQHLQFIFVLIFSREMVIHGQWIAWLIENIYLANILKSTFSVFMNTQSEKWIVDVVAAKLMKCFYWFIIHTIS